MGAGERTLLLIKPDAVSRGLTGDIIALFIERGLTIGFARKMNLVAEQADSFYPAEEKWLSLCGQKLLLSCQRHSIDAKECFGTVDPAVLGKMIKEWLIEYIISGPVVAVIVYGEGVVEGVREIVGPTDPSIAPSDTIRGRWGQDSILQAGLERKAAHNLVHASGSKEEAEREISVLVPDF